MGTADGADGGDGEDTIFREKSSGTVLARFKGATGGRGGFLFVSATRRGLVPGGAPFSAYRPKQRLFEAENATSGTEPILTGPGVGGEGTSSNLHLLSGTTARNGSGSLEGRSGGAGGVPGSGPGASAPAGGGGGGGGGGASAYGNGYPGKDGGNGNGSGAGGAAPASGGGSSAAGIGGGGGGGGGTGTTSGGAGSTGTGGNAGVFILRPVG